MRRYRLSRPAKADLDRIWFRETNIETADRFVDTITARFPFLADMPEAGRAPGDMEPGLYSFPVEDYMSITAKDPEAES
jgi:plasmid stabilization system protein ParE